LRITDLKILRMSTPTQARTNWLFCRIETDAGLYGLGEASLQYKDAALIAELETFKRFLVGQDPFQIEHIWTSLHRRVTWSGGPVTMSAISAIDLALWDIVRLPVARQGPGRASVRAAGRQGTRPGARLCQRLAGRGAGIGRVRPARGRGGGVGVHLPEILPV
jgi:L-alanine-DL-glutamate epimerase-like enolase superfamily enzyme